jgi:hypothetical protein
MDHVAERKMRLHALLDLARASRGWSRAKLGRALGRDPTKVYPDSGNPKADFLMCLAEVLEWPVGEVIETIWGEGPLPVTIGARERISTGIDFRELYEQARLAHGAGEYQRVVDHARAMHEAADSEERRAFACAMEYSGWDGLGRYLQGVDAAKRGLRHAPISTTTRNILRADLANAWYSLWELTPALGTAEVLADWYESNPPERKVDEKRPAFVHYVRGNTRRRLMSVEPELREEHGRLALADLHRSADAYVRLSEELEDTSLGGIANTCRGAIMEVEVEMGFRDADDAIETLLSGVRSVGEDEELVVGDWLESYGWWSIFGSNLALRHLTGAEMQRSVREFTDGALRVAERLNNWAMRERVFTLQFALHRVLAETSGLELDYTIGEQDQSLITATMGRFPTFRAVGWQILETAKVVAVR